MLNNFLYLFYLLSVTICLIRLITIDFYVSLFYL